MIFLKNYITLPEFFPLSTNHRFNSTRRKFIFYPTLTEQQAFVLLFPLFLVFQIPHQRCTRSITPPPSPQYTLPPLRYSHLEYTTSALLSSTRNNPYPLKVTRRLSSFVSLPPPLIFSPSDSRPIFSDGRATAATDLKTNVSVYSKRESSDDERCYI